MHFKAICVGATAVGMTGGLLMKGVLIAALVGMNAISISHHPQDLVSEVITAQHSFDLLGCCLGVMLHQVNLQSQQRIVY